MIVELFADNSPLSAKTVPFWHTPYPGSKFTLPLLSFGKWRCSRLRLRSDTGAFAMVDLRFDGAACSRAFMAIPAAS